MPFMTGHSPLVLAHRVCWVSVLRLCTARVQLRGPGSAACQAAGWQEYQDRGSELCRASNIYSPHTSLHVGLLHASWPAKTQELPSQFHSAFLPIGHHCQCQGWSPLLRRVGGRLGVRTKPAGKGWQGQEAWPPEGLFCDGDRTPDECGVTTPDPPLEELRLYDSWDRGRRSGAFHLPSHISAFGDGLHLPSYISAFGDGARCGGCCCCCWEACLLLPAHREGGNSVSDLACGMAPLGLSPDRGEEHTPPPPPPPPRTVELRGSCRTTSGKGMPASILGSYAWRHVRTSSRAELV